MLTTKEEAAAIIHSIVDKVKGAQEGVVHNELLFEDHTAYTEKNEFVLFLKPEITLKDSSVKFDEIVDLVLAKVFEFGFKVNMVKVLSGNYLKEYDVMAKHYGVINAIAKNAKASITEAGKNKFEEIFEESFESANILGGIEFQHKFPHYTAQSLNEMWNGVQAEKLAGGTYAGKVNENGEDFYVVNGFHPSQLEHYYAEGQSIVVLSLIGNVDWADARNNFIGVTNPANANAGSIRNEFLNKQKDLGIPVVNGGLNGVHLSAGPIEAVNELMRFASDFSDSSKMKQLSDYNIGKSLAENFGSEQVQAVLNNDKKQYEGSEVNAFDLTEEKNASEMVDILQPVYS